MQEADGSSATDLDSRPGARHGGGPPSVRQVRLEGVEGTSRSKRWVVGGGRCTVGSHKANDVAIDDRTVSRFHCEIVLEEEGASVRDLGSRNGTLVDGVRVERAWLQDGSLLGLGRTTLRFSLTEQRNDLPVSERTELGALVSCSVAMRTTFALLERAAESDSTVLIEGETGTGKDAAAETLHELGARREGPFVVVDCGAVSRQLIEDELFGHERGAFTGAEGERAGAFEAADGGTVFLDEIGELPAELQPKLLRVLEKQTVRRLGGSQPKKVDVRVIAATHRDLRMDVNRARFRQDLYYRLAVITITMPPLRERLEDIPLLTEHILKKLGTDAPGIVTPELLARLRQADWPGNVRELRNYLERCVALRMALPVPESPEDGDGDEAHGEAPWDAGLSYAEARRCALEHFEGRYVRELLERHGDNVTAAAKAAGMNRPYLHRLLRRYGLR